IGATGNLQRRLQKHLQSTVEFTSKVKDWQLKYSEVFETNKDALDRERRIKSWKSRKKIESTIFQKT
ncbi:MAG: GIY-YIG nuclease family protein, partial [Gramella sp.]|nr:GIY-YIG nuclease family protein [Christiangramia sp.]